MRMFEDEKPLSHKEKERVESARQLRENNLKILQSEITGKEVVLKSNVHFERKERAYLVNEVKDDYIKNNKGQLIRGIRLVNSDISIEEQPFLRYPTALIEKTKSDNKHRLILVYASEVQIERDFRSLHRDTKPDLEIYIYY